MGRAGRASAVDSKGRPVRARRPSSSSGVRRILIPIVLTLTAASGVVLAGGSPVGADVDSVVGSAFGAQVSPASTPPPPLDPTPNVTGSATEPADGFGPSQDTVPFVSRPGVLAASSLTASTEGGRLAGEDHLGFARSAVTTAAAVVFDGSVTARAVEASCQADGNGARGTMRISDAQFLGTPLPASPPPNTSFSSAGFDLVLNEQIVVNIPGAATIRVNALRVSGTDELGRRADVIVGHVECAARGLDVLSGPVVTPNLVTSATQRAFVGQGITDAADLSGGQSPTGTITFNAFGPADPTCAGPAAFTSTVPVAGNGTYSSSIFTPTVPGTFLWVASYSGDANNAPVSTACADPSETSTVITPPSIQVDASVTPPSLPEPGGTFTFSVTVTNTGTEALTLTSLADDDDVYGDLADRLDSTCGSSIGFVLVPGATVQCTFPGDFTGVAGASQTIIVTATAVHSDGFTVTDDDDAVASITAPSPNSIPLLSTQATPTATVGQPIGDTATLEAPALPGLPGFVGFPSGTITFTLFDEPTCGGTPVFTSPDRPLGGGPVPTALSDPFVPTAPGSYYWVATYSGDTVFQPVAGACGDPGEVTVVDEVLPPVVAVTPPAIVNQASPTGTVGSPIADVATLSGGQTPTGTITFNLYGPTDPGCAAAAVFSSTVAVSGGGAYGSGDFSPTVAGTYRWVASYSGDADNPTVATACGDPAATTVVTGPGLIGTATGVVTGLVAPVDQILGSILSPPQPVTPPVVTNVQPPVVLPTPAATDAVNQSPPATTTTTTPPARSVRGAPTPAPVAPSGTTGIAAAPTTSSTTTTTTVSGPAKQAAPAPPTRIKVASDDDLPLAQVVAGFGTLGLAAALLLLVLLLRRRDRRPLWAAPAMRRGEPRTHSHVADDILGGAPGPDLGQAGPAAARIAEACPGEDFAAPLIATLLWEAFVTDPRFGHVLRAVGASERALTDGQVVVVRHAGGTRHDLLVFDPGYSAKPVPIPVDLLPSATTAANRRHRLSWPDLLASEPRQPWPSLDALTVLKALEEAARATKFSLVVAKPPRILVTGCPTPGCPVSLGSAEPALATAGAVVEAPDGTLALTTVLHAVKGHESVWVGGHEGRVISTHEATDSCLVAVPDFAIDPDSPGGAGPLSGVSPRQFDRTTFDGIASGAKTTTVTSWDISILARQQFLGSKVYTTPDTVPGDSGAALIDSGDQILGFAVYRSAFGEPIEYSAWAWADQVFGAHGARLLGSEQPVK